MQSDNDIIMYDNSYKIKLCIIKWLEKIKEKTKCNYIQFVSDVCHYDFVFLIDLFGTAFDLPDYVSPACYDINQDIASLVTKGLDPHIQHALDYCRVVGNNAVHPGEIKLDDSADIANTLFEMINYIVEDLISRPKKIQERFNSLPKGALNAIEKRDETSKTI